MTVRSQDILLLLRLAAHPSARWTYAQLATELGISVSQVHAALTRAKHAGLLRPDGKSPNTGSLAEFVVHGLRYVFPAERRGITRGFPTAGSAPPLVSKLAQGDGPPIVWPDPNGPVRGEGLLPIHPAVPAAARRDARLYELVALVDALRIGRARERKLAIDELKRRFS